MTSWKWILIILLILIFLFFLDQVIALGQGTDVDTVKSITAVRANPHVKIDGILDEEFWHKAPRSTGFTQFQPDEGQPASESTFVMTAYDDEALYVAMEMYDSEPDKIISRLTRRDRYAENDLVNLIIDSYHDHQTAYAFVVSVSGTQRDSYYYNDNWSDDSWDAVWESAARITDWGWIAEIKIPFHCLRFSCEENPVWGFYCSRRIARKSELSRWIYIPESANGFISYFGHIKGLKNLTAPRRLEVRPYVVSYEQTEPKSLGNPDGRDFFSNVGFDFKYGITSNITLDATVNPDFGQVEQDETVLNLSTFETWYQEKRPFFLEGFKIFETPFDLFYSRRIGKAPTGWPDNVDYFIDRPSATTILFAGKMTGKTKGGTSIGVVEAVTQNEKAEFMHTDGYSKKEVIEPQTNYFAGRVMQDVLKNSTIGVLVTAVNQKSSYPAYTGDVDWKLRFRNGDYSCWGQVMGSKTGPEENGWGIWQEFRKDGGEHVRGEIGIEYLDRSLNLNHMGFLSRNNFKEVWGWVQYRTTKQWWIIRKTWNNFNLCHSANLSGVKLTRGGNFNYQIELVNFWMVGGGIWQDYDNTYSDRETRGGPPAPIPIGQNWWVWMQTDARKSWQIAPNFEMGDTRDGRYKQYSLWLTLLPKPNIEISGGPSYYSSEKVSRWLTYLEDDEGSRTDDIFGEEKMKRFNMTFRATYTFTKDLTLQVYAQPFIAAVDYENFKKLVPPDGYQYVEETVYNQADEKPDFKWKSFNSNMVLRWEYRPGSTLFLVWTQNRDTWKQGAGDFKFKSDWNDMFETIPGNTFLIKMNYWWSI
jgi:hypothetical protein